MTDDQVHQDPDETTEGLGERLLHEREDASEALLDLRRREVTLRVILLAAAFIAIVAGVVYPIWEDKADSDERRQDLDAIAANTEQLKQLVLKAEEDDSPEAQQALVRAVESLIDIVKCDNRANLDDLISDLEERGLIIYTDDNLACIPPPTFQFPPSEAEG